MGAKTTLSLDEFQHLPDDDRRHELDEGELISMPPASEEHGDVCAEILSVLRVFVKQQGLGRVYTPDTGFVLGEDTLRSPDVAFVRKGRLVGIRREGFFQGAPDLAVEVFSPSDSVPQLMRKIRQYFDAGCHTVWVAYPASKEIHVLQAGAKDRILKGSQALKCPELLPGFSTPVKSFFD